MPPPPDYLEACLADFETFLYDESVPTLIKAGLAHVQFETMHPFLDGNGRLGRLLITLLLCHAGLLEEPLLYLSLYLKQHRPIYYDLLQEVRLKGTWERWLSFFLEGIHKSALQALTTANLIINLFDQDAVKIAALGRARFSCTQILEYMRHLPQVTVLFLAKELGIAAPTARTSLNQLVSLDILEEVTGKKRDKIYVYRRYLAILEEGAEPL